MLDLRTLLAFDVETTSKVDKRFALQPCRRLRDDAGVGSHATAWFEVIPGQHPRICSEHLNAPTVEDHRNLLLRAAREGLTIVGWNTAFDVGWLIAEGLREEVMAVKWLDAMQLWKHVAREPEYDVPGSKRQSFSLKTAVAEYFPLNAGYEAGIDFHSDDPEDVAKRLRYNEMDAEFTLLLAARFIKELTAQGDQRLRNALLEAQSIPLVSNSGVRGLYVNAPAAAELDTALKAQIETLGAELAQHGATPEVLASPKQLGKLLFEDWGLPVQNTTPSGNPSTDKIALYMLSPMDRRVKLVKDYREAVGNHTKFVTNVLASVEYNGDGYTRPSPNIYGTYTGRMTFGSKQGKGKDEVQTGFAIHQMKRAAAYRRLVAAPPGYTMVEWDAAGQEYRWMAVESDDTTMLGLCQPGEDPHSYMGGQIGHVDYRQLIERVHAADSEAKKVRQMGKVGNLSCQFRIGPDKLYIQALVAHGMEIDLAEARVIHRTYHSTYPGVQAYWRRKIAEAKRKGYAETLAGRRVQLQGSWTSKALGWKLESSAINFPIQGVGADQKYLALAVLRNYLPQYDGHFYFELHDGLYAIFPTDKAEKATRHIQQVLNNLPYKKAWGFTPPIPLPWDAKIGPNWGDMIELK